MAVSFTHAYRALAVGGLAAAALIGAFALGSSQGSAATAPSTSGGQTPVSARPAVLTSGLSIWPNYPDNSQTPSGYSVSESLTSTLNSLAAAARARRRRARGRQRHDGQRHLA